VFGLKYAGEEAKNHGDESVFSGNKDNRESQ
jgi:hypothetical protein